MSCEIDTHLQTWATMFEFRIMDTVLLHMQASCAPNMKWSDAIIISEVELTLSVLSKGLSLSSVVPNFDRFSIHHQAALHHGVGELRDKLHDCKNPVIGNSIEVSSDTFLSDTVFVKYGGQVWREQLLSPEYEQKVAWTTRKILNPEYSLPCNRAQPES